MCICQEYVWLIQVPDYYLHLRNMFFGFDFVHSHLQNMRCTFFRLRPVIRLRNTYCMCFFGFSWNRPDPPTETYEMFLGFTTPTKHKKMFRGLSHLPKHKECFSASRMGTCIITKVLEKSSEKNILF
jgi:hypothetical protein